MCITWLITLLIYGFVNSFSDISGLFWFLLIPFAIGDKITVTYGKK